MNSDNPEVRTLCLFHGNIGIQLQQIISEFCALIFSALSDAFYRLFYIFCQKIHIHRLFHVSNRIQIDRCFQIFFICIASGKNNFYFRIFFS